MSTVTNLTAVAVSILIVLTSYVKIKQLVNENLGDSFFRVQILLFDFAIMEWFSGSIPEAVAEAKRNNKLFLVYIEGTDDMSKAMTNTYNDATISQKLRAENIIALKLAANSVPYVQFCAIYPVIIIPSSYFIGVNGTPIEIVTGNLTPAEYSAKLDKILEVHQKSLCATKSATTPQASSSKSSDSIQERELPDINQPSTSQSSDEPESTVPLEERVERAKALLEVKKQLQENDEKEKEKKQELERRNVGKALQRAQQEQKDNELKEWAKNRAKEKEEERVAREKVRALIAQDRAERAARYQQSKDAEQAERERLARNREEQEQAARSAALNSNEARIQFRLPDGSSTNHVFPADSSLDDARRFVINEVRPPFSNFSLCTTFPRRHFTQSNYSESLRDLQLAPSAVLLILPEQSISSFNSSSGFWSMMFWTLMSPFIYSWRTITSFFSGIFHRDQPSQPSSEPPKSQNEQSTSNQPTDGVQRRGGGFVRREGNVYRLNNQNDDGENNTWNGNSTQQM